MFSYLHCYMPQSWAGQIKRGFIGETDGIKFPQMLLLKENQKFNIAAAKGGVLHSIIKELNCPFYIDRLQGGCYYEYYTFCHELIDEYCTLLGDKFLGFQMHEWMSNFKSDLKKLEKAGCTDWTEDGIKKAIFKIFPFPCLFLESQSAAELSCLRKPETADEFGEYSKNLFEKRQQSVDGLLLPCDSAFMATKMELELGAKALMPEVGAQTANTRIQLSLTRGMAKACGIPWGTYYEPWGGEPFSACYYKTDNINEWGIGENSDFPFETQGENGGSSRSLQWRIHLYSYLSGASFISEEWGMCNTFYDWNDFDITPYGKVKYDFLQFVKKYSDIGKHYTPIAVVLPKDIKVLDGVYNEKSLASGYSCYTGFPVEDGKAQKLRVIRKGLKSLFADAAPMLGNETTSMINSDIPDALDIIYEDNASALKNYAYLVDLTSNSFFAKTYKNICAIQDVTHLLENILPCKVEGSLHWFVNRKESTWLLTIFNNSGIYRSVEKGEIALPETEKTAIVTLKSNVSLKRLEGSEKLTFDGGKYFISIPAGGWFFGEFGI